ncbi:hypothetical protein N7490_001164 [Penicillium lividum]|nr:hypothetical protein N7490_001164 [Penicillium lividum]
MHDGTLLPNSKHNTELCAKGFVIPECLPVALHHDKTMDITLTEYQPTFHPSALQLPSTLGQAWTGIRQAAVYVSSEANKANHPAS